MSSRREPKFNREAVDILKVDVAVRVLQRDGGFQLQLQSLILTLQVDNDRVQKVHLQPANNPRPDHVTEMVVVIRA